MNQGVMVEGIITLVSGEWSQGPDCFGQRLMGGYRIDQKPAAAASAR